MSFGRNPHVAKAELAEQKALAAGDDTARSMAWRDAARAWDRAAEREMSDKRREEYTRRADDARRSADGEPPPAEDDVSPVSSTVPVPPPPAAKRVMN
ncbi:MAG: hypothetical protein U0325_16400 [Polyangiales bacterium]